MPCGLGDGLPIGAMLIGKHFDEETIYAAAGAFEASWRLEEVLTRLLERQMHDTRRLIKRHFELRLDYRQSRFC